MALDVTGLAEDLRVEIGSPGDLEISTSTLRELVKDAIEEVGSALSRGFLEIDSSISTVADTQSYTLPSNVRRVHDAFWGSGADIVSTRFDSDLPADTTVSTLSGRFRSIKMIEEIQRESLRKGFGRRWEVINGKIYLEPIPNAAGTLYLVVGKDITADDLPDRVQSTVLDGAAARALRILALRRSSLAGVQSAGGLVQFGAASSLEEQAKVRESRFRNAVMMLEVGVV